MPETSEPDPIAIALFSEILMAEQLMKARLTKALPKGMELSHFTVLNFLASQTQERTPAQLARLLNLTKGAMTNTITKLENNGYIHVRPDWDDARRKLVAISDAGLLARLDAIRAVEPVFDHVVAQVGREDVKTALPFLRALRESLG